MKFGRNQPRSQPIVRVARLEALHASTQQPRPLQCPLSPNLTVPPSIKSGGGRRFRCFPADYSSDWHTAPRRQYIFILGGQMEIGIGDGSTRRFGPGDVVLADDLTGQGHTTRSVGLPRISATVPVSA
jgi:hypothetical protein